MSTDTPQTWADMARELQAANARLREELELIRAALTGDDYASLPSDLPTVRMAHTIRADHDKFRNQVRDTCHRAEQTEKELAEAKRKNDDFKRIGQQFERDARSHFDQSCINLKRAEQAEACALEYKTEHAALLGTSQWQETEIADLRDDVKRLMQTVSECEERALANEKDAARYRFLCEGEYQDDGEMWNAISNTSIKDEWDAEIDAAIGAKHD